MKIFFSILFAFIFTFPGLSQKEELKKKIIWEENLPLTWHDFKGPVDIGSKFYAQTNAGIYYQVQQTSQTQFLIFVETFFDPKHSWYKKGQVTDYLLKHEQVHFDIHELHSRLFIKSLLETEFNESNKVFGRIRDLYVKAMEDARDINDMYDKETNHSVDKVQQMVWNKKVDAMLTDTEQYDLKEVDIEIK
jgi:hypothetical protein